MFRPVGDGELAAEIAQLSLAATGGGEYRISALPGDIPGFHPPPPPLHRPASSPAAGEPSGPSSRRCAFPSPPTQPESPPRSPPRPSASSTSDAWLRLAATRLPGGGELYFRNRTPGEEEKQVEALFWQCPTFQLPCFEMAAKVWLRLGFVDLALPRSGVFAGLTELRLEHVNFSCGRERGYMVSALRCLVLRQPLGDSCAFGVRHSDWIGGAHGYGADAQGVECDSLLCLEEADRTQGAAEPHLKQDRFHVGEIILRQFLS